MKHLHFEFKYEELDYTIDCNAEMLEDGIQIYALRIDEVEESDFIAEPKFFDAAYRACAKQFKQMIEDIRLYG